MSLALLKNLYAEGSGGNMVSFPMPINWYYDFTTCLNVSLYVRDNWKLLVG